MTIGIALPTSVPKGIKQDHNVVDLLLEQAREAAAAGVGAAWFSQGFDQDAIGMATMAAREIPDIEIGTSVVPIYPRHPIALASQAQTAQAASHGRFTLGIGLGERESVERAFGTAFQPIQHLREFLVALRSLFADGAVDLAGKTLTARTGPQSAEVPGARPAVPILVAAMGEQALAVAGELADGTVPYMAGPKTIAEHIVPRISKAAQAAGRPAPRIIAGLPALVTSDVAGMRARARDLFGIYRHSSSLRKVMEREGIDHPADLALIGDEDMVAEGIQEYLDAGATDVLVTNTGLNTDADRLRTWRLLGSLGH